MISIKIVFLMTKRLQRKHLRQITSAKSFSKPATSANLKSIRKKSSGMQSASPPTRKKNTNQNTKTKGDMKIKKSTILARKTMSIRESTNQEDNKTDNKNLIKRDKKTKRENSGDQSIVI